MCYFICENNFFTNFTFPSCTQQPFVLWLECEKYNVILRGRVQFPTGGKSPRPTQVADLV